MSSGSQVALLPPLARGETAPRLRTAAAPERPLVLAATFAAFAAYGVLRWATLERAAPTWRLLGLLTLALLLVGAGLVSRRRSSLIAAVLAVLAAIAVFPLAGVPIAWITHLRIAVTASAVGEGLSALPGVLVPYTGVNEWVRLVTALGAGVLLLDAAAMVALAPRGARGPWRAAAALPLLALAVIPSTIVHPRSAPLQGVIVFALLAAFMWGDRVEQRRLAGAIALCAAAALAALIAAPALERHRPWLDYQALAGRLAKTTSVSFDWSQGYGPIDWPRTGRAVLEVSAARPDYWKAENLDLFDGRGWTIGDVPGAQEPANAISRAARGKWTQTIQVTVRAMVTTQVIAAGWAAAPTHLPRAFVPGESPGTWTAGGQLASGASYSIRTYSPRPRDAELAAAGTAYPSSLLPGYLSIYIPAADALPGQVQQVLFAPFGSSRSAAYGPTSSDPSAVMRASPYAAAYALAQRLRRSAATPFAYVAAVEHRLSRGFSYDENPAAASYPLETFLVGTHAGYCQQFAGAMALLLRMGGVPARVAVGFTPGAYDAATRRWIVSDLDAHAWVEAWFPRYGWVRFDPTPIAAPALGGRSPIAGSTSSSATPPPRGPSGHGHGTPAGSRTAAQGPGRRAGVPGGAPALGITVALLVLLVLAGAVLTRPLPAGERELLELERAFARAGRPLPPGATLLSLERRLAVSPPAAAYVQSLRRARFADGWQGPSPSERRALRAQLRQGLGLLGPLRALWALPPRRARRGGA